jgi:hypothetical protein
MYETVADNPMQAKCRIEALGTKGKAVKVLGGSA